MSDALKEEMQNWISYRDAHPDITYTAEWADALLRKIAKENGLDD